jgi:fatty acid-binding protein DegV
VEFSPAMAIHTGPGVVGVAWLRGRGPAEPVPG